MSNIGKIPIYLPPNVEIHRTEGFLYLKGPQGEKQMYFPLYIELKQESNKIFLKAPKKQKAIFSILHRKLQNYLWGLVSPFKKKIELVGTGYKIEIKENKLYFKLGFSHEVIVAIPKEITVYSNKSSQFFIQSYDIEKLGEFSANIRRIRPPEPYKGKGVICNNEKIRRKEGKKL